MRLRSGSKPTKEELFAYRQVFLKTPAGRMVLKHLTGNLGYFSLSIVTEEDRIRRNVAAEILSMCGVTHELNMDQFIDSIIDIPLKAEQLNGQTNQS